MSMFKGTSFLMIQGCPGNARKGENMLASYLCGEANDCTQFERFAYPKARIGQ
jgi:hypothetical protein